MLLIPGVVLLLLSIALVHCRSVKECINESFDETENNTDGDYYSVSAILERVNKNAGKTRGDFTIIRGDIAVHTELQNADPCTSTGCTWPRSQNKKVYVPYVISSQFSCSEQHVIQRTMKSFQKSTCIRFVPRTNQTHYINIISDRGCYSYVGRIGGNQSLSLERPGCIHHQVVQHELLHALGFDHEQCRSDRDLHVKILYENIEPDYKFAFDKIDTNNLNTSYDYNSVMHYGRYAFSKNTQPTIVPVPDPDAPIGLATEMSSNDILRVQRLYCT